MMTEFDIMTPEEENTLVDLLRRQRSEFYDLRCNLSKKVAATTQQITELQAMLRGLEQQEQDLLEDLDRFRTLYEEADDLIRHYTGGA